MNFGIIPLNNTEKFLLIITEVKYVFYLDLK